MHAELEQLRGPAWLVRVFQHPEQTAAALDPYGWFTVIDTPNPLEPGIVEIKGLDKTLTPEAFAAITSAILGGGFSAALMKRHGRMRRITREQAERWMR